MLLFDLGSAEDGNHIKVEMVLHFLLNLYKFLH